MADIVANLPPALQDAAAAIIALGGGQPNADVDAAAVAQLRQDYEDEQQAIADQAAIDVIDQRINGKVSTAFDTLNNKVYALGTRAEQEALANTIQTYLDSL